MNRIRKLFVKEDQDPRVNSSILSPKYTILNALFVTLYSGVLLLIFNHIDFVPENADLLAATIVTLILVVSLSLAIVSSYVQYIHFTKPLLNLAKAAREVSAGNYKIQLSPHREDGKVDEIDALYEDFNTMVNDLDSTEMLKSSFISNVTHELKTPIAVISNYATLLSEEEISEEEEKEYITKIRTASSDLSEMISNILQLSRLDNDQVKLTMEPMDLSEEVIQCILGRELLLDQKELELELDLPDNLMIESDRGLLRIVINNLLSNALKFTPEKGTIKIDLSGNKEETVFRISDSGCGMDEETMKHIFDKFYQGDTSHHAKGNGLGLAMVKEILELLEGRIEVKSEPGAGSEFTVILRGTLVI